jgi:hypothetical protein
VELIRFRKYLAGWISKAIGSSEQGRFGQVVSVNMRSKPLLAVRYESQV